ncbi:hypothetical protein TH63_10830 [Rufibacter radiotolerans]|uniref:Uncharacterized protein n=1 Tax=Rufibacter radiotolerans TaxID=1379910 RepID=A0A0H4VJN5_9BACT|nr:hypothetical protein TH63_10830 [Rufibacter radiotolerans]
MGVLGIGRFRRFTQGRPFRINSVFVSLRPKRKVKPKWFGLRGFFLETGKKRAKSWVLAD